MQIARFRHVSGALFLIACSADMTGGTMPIPLGVSATVDGASWRATSTQVTYISGNLRVMASDDSSTLTFAIQHGSQPGDYSLNSTTVAIATYNNGSNYWGGLSGNESGSITIESYDTTGVTGRFTISVHALSNQASGYKNFTSGKFNVKF